MLKKFLMILIMVIILMCAGCMTTYDLTHATTTKSGITKTTTKTNLTLVKEYCQKYYKGYNVKVVAHVPKHRNNGEYVYIEKVATTSKGGYWGKTKDGYLIKYNKKVKKGKKVIVYLIYNPSNEVVDDVICKVCNHIIKGDKKTIKAPKKIDCPCCGNGLSNDCVYYIHNEKRHMTETEIKSFDWLEYHYLADDGQWYELRTGNTEPVEKPDYVTNY